MSDPTENASGFTFQEKPQMSERFMVHFEQIVQMYEKQEEYLKILGEFNKRQEEAEKEIRENNANQTNESTNTELSICDCKEEPIVQLEPVIPDPCDDVQSICTSEILYSA
jgi:hypothetical protein